jgi:hypothetical protein
MNPQTNGQPDRQDPESPNAAPASARRRPRGTCPVCKGNVALTPKTRRVGRHGRGGPCEGTRMKPAPDDAESEPADAPTKSPGHAP